jgi:Flp pilus assembly protein TadD
VGDVQAARGVATVLTLGGPNDAQKQRAEEWLRPILTAHPNDPALLFSWGSYCLVSGARDVAVKALKIVLRFSPDNTLARNNLAYLLVSDGKPEEALEQVNRAIALAGPTKSFRDTRGLALISAKRHDEAVQVFKELVEESPEDPVMRLHLAAAELAAGHEAEAREQLERAESLELHEAKLPAFDRQSLASLRSAVGS